MGIYGVGRVWPTRRIWSEAGGGVTGLGYQPPPQISSLVAAACARSTSIGKTFMYCTTNPRRRCASSSAVTMLEVASSGSDGGRVAPVESLGAAPDDRRVAGPPDKRDTTERLVRGFVGHAAHR